MVTPLAGRRLGAVAAAACIGLVCMALGFLGVAQARDDAIPTSECNPTASSSPPAPGFNPIAASAVQLAQNNFPPRPTNSAALQAWTTAMSHATTYVPPDPVCSTVTHDAPPPGGPHSVNDTGNYAGHVMDNSYENGEDFTTATAIWTQPAVPSAAGYSNYQTAPDASFWTGLGYSAILQAGCDSISTANSPTYKCWTEDFPLGTDWEGPKVRPGDEVYVSVTYNGNLTTTYFIEDVTTDKYTPVTHPSPFVGYRAADFINERLGPYLPNFGSMSFQQCVGASDSGAYQLQSYNNNVDINDSVPGATPGPVNNSNSSFPVTWEAN